MTIFTTRFGDVEIVEEDVLHFNEGLLGFGNLRTFVLLDDPNDEIFAWLQSCEMPDVAFPVLEPELFATSFKLNLTRHDLASLSAENEGQVRAFSIITIPDNPTLMTANLKAPVIINIQKRVGRQCVLQDSQLAIREPIFTQLQKRVVSNPQQSMKAHIANLGVTVHLPAQRDPEASR